MKSTVNPKSGQLEVERLRETHEALSIMKQRGMQETANGTGACKSVLATIKSSIQDFIKVNLKEIVE